MHSPDSEVLVKALGATGSPVTITDARLPDNPIIYCNDAFLELSGYSRDEIIGNNCRFLQGDDTNRKDVAALRKAIDDGEASNTTLLNYTKDGRAFWNDLQVSPVFDDHGELTHFIGFQNNISERLEKERLALLTQKLENEIELMSMEKEKLMNINEVKDNFISIASHQLRTPATAVKQYLNMVLDGMYGDLTTHQHKAIDTANRNNERQIDIIEDLLSIAQVDSEKIVLSKRRVNLRKLVQSVIDDFTLRAKDANVVIYSPSCNEPVYLEIDRRLIRTALDNLIDNAIKYSKPGTEVTIGITENDDELAITIKDTGLGMTTSDQEKIFEKFGRSSVAEAKNIGGSGLGLYWVKSVMTLHDATISVDSELGVGSTFTLTFKKF